jgi:antitoxin VapB
MTECPDNRLREMPLPFRAQEPWPTAPVRILPETQKLRAKIFKSGNSLALRLPAALGLEAGMEMELTVQPDGGYLLNPVAAKKKKFNIEKVLGCAIGSGLQFIKPEDRVFKERPLLWDDPEWRAKYMPDMPGE